MGSDLFDLLKYSEQIDQQELKDLSNKILGSFPYVPPYMPQNLKQKVAEALIKLTQNKIVILNYPSFSRVMNGEDFDKRESDFKQTSEIWAETNARKKEIETMLNSFTHNILQSLDQAIQNNMLPAQLKILVQNAVDEFITESYNKAISSISKSSTLDSLNASLKNVANTISQLKYGKDVVESEGTKFKIPAMLEDGTTVNVEIPLNAMAEALINNKNITAQNLELAWSDTFRALVVGQNTDIKIPVNAKKSNPVPSGIKLATPKS